MWRFKTVMLAVFSLCLNIYAHPREKLPWYQLAEVLSGVSDSDLNKTLQQLRATPKLIETLKKQILSSGPDPTKKTFLAFDVIAALKLKELLPVLMTYSKEDRSGYSFHTINSLVTDDNLQSIVKFYRASLSESHISAAARIALLDILARFGAVLSTEELKNFLKDPVIELRATALSYIRSFVLRGKQPQYIPLIQISVENGPYRVKKQAEFLLQELASAKK